MKIWKGLFFFMLGVGQLWGDTYFITNFSKKYYGKAEGLAYTPKVTVLLPTHYRDSGKKYPVLYMHDGQNLFDAKKAFGGNEWQVDETLTRLVKEGRIPDLIVVGVHNTATRIDDYTPSYISNEFIPNGGGGKLKAYAQFLVNRLKPWVDSHFPTLTDASNTVVMGSSLGGLASFYLAGWYPDVFGMAGVISPSFWWNQVAVTNDLRQMPFKSRIYIDGGWKEGADESSMVVYMRRVREGLIKKGFKQGKDLMFYEDPVGVHNEAAWARRLFQPLLFFFGRDYQDIVESAEVLLTPDIIGVGDESYLTLQIKHKSGVSESLPDVDWELFPSENAEIIRRGAGVQIKALKAGKLTISANGKIHAVKDISVRELSRNLISISISFEFPSGTESADLEVYRYKGQKTNYTIPIDFSDPAHPVLNLVKAKGVGIRFKIRDQKGRYAQNLRGKLFRKNLIFRKDRNSRVRVKAWQ